MNGIRCFGLFTASLSLLLGALGPMVDHIFVPLHFVTARNAEAVAAHITSIPSARKDELRVRIWADPVIGDYDI